MNWDNGDCIVLMAGIALFFISWSLLIRPIERRLQRALDKHFAKEIARSLYHECLKRGKNTKTWRSSISTPCYTPHDAREQRILDETLKAFQNYLTEETLPKDI